MARDIGKLSAQHHRRPSATTEAFNKEDVAEMFLGTCNTPSEAVSVALAKDEPAARQISSPNAERTYR